MGRVREGDPVEIVTTTSSYGDTQMRLRNRGTPAGFSRWMAFMRSLSAGANQKDLRYLKDLLENARS